MASGERGKSPKCGIESRKRLAKGLVLDLIGNVRAVAQLGSALEWGSRGRGFKSRQPDQTSRSFP